MQGNSANEKMMEIRRWHMSAPLKWSDNGYHYGIDRDGTVVVGRPLSRVPASVKGHNRGTVAIVLFGGHGSNENDQFSDHFTAEQDASLRSLLALLKTHYPIQKVSGHNEYAAKACPGFQVRAWLGN